MDAPRMSSISKKTKKKNNDSNNNDNQMDAAMPREAYR